MLTEVEFRHVLICSPCRKRRSTVHCTNEVVVEMKQVQAIITTELERVVLLCVLL
jgi:hypothetical protein